MKISKIKKEIQYLFALSFFKEIDFKKVQNLFDQLMNQGIYFDEFLDFENINSHDTAASLSAFKKSIEKIDLVYPRTKSAARIFIIQHYLEKIQNKKIDVLKEFEKLCQYIRYLPLKSQKFFEVEKLISIYWNEVDTDYPQAQENTVQKILAEAQKWIDSHTDKVINEKTTKTPQTIAIIGANGFIGSYITAKLLKEGNHVICAVRDVNRSKLKFPSAEVVHIDFNSPDIKLVLSETDVVINAAGVLGSSEGNNITQVHSLGPINLYNQCIKAGVKRIIHISALGIDDENTTDYALTKKEADNYLKKQKNIDWVILQPSLIYASGCFGGTSLFRSLATFPYFIPLVGQGEQKFQPIHIDDLTEIISVLTKKEGKIQKVLKVVGPDVVSIKDILIKFRSWLGVHPAKFTLKTPEILVRFAAKLGDLFKSNLLNSTLYKMMQIPNTADQNDMIECTGVKPRSFEAGLETEPLTSQSLWHARLYLFKPIIKLVLSLFWILSGIIPSIISPEIGISSINELGFSIKSSKFIIYSSCLLDVAMGIILLLSNRAYKICLFQITLIILYTFCLSIIDPNLWLNPFGLLLKNIPIILLTLILIIIDRDK